MGTSEQRMVIRVKKTEFQKWKSIMAKLDNKLKKEDEERKKK